MSVFTFHTGGFILNCGLYLQHRHKLQCLPKGGDVFYPHKGNTAPSLISHLSSESRERRTLEPLLCVFRAPHSSLLHTSVHVNRTAQGLEWSAEDELCHSFFPEVTLSDYKSRKKSPRTSCFSITQFSSLPSAFFLSLAATTANSSPAPLSADSISANGDSKKPLRGRDFLTPRPYTWNLVSAQ